MTRFDYYDILPKGMDAYLANHGHHYSKPMLEWAVGMMKDREGKKVSVIDRKELDEKMSAYGVKLKRTEGYYDPVYVFLMAKSDYMGSSIPDEIRLVNFVRDYIDDPDGNPEKAFDHFITDCMAKGIDVPWSDLI